MPPTFGGKSLVTRRWRSTAPSCLSVGGEGSKLAGGGRIVGVDEVRAAEAGGGPGGVGPEQVVGGAGRIEVAGEGGGGAGVGAVADVAEHDEGVAAEVTGVSAGHVPAAVALEEGGVVGLVEEG